MLSAERRGRDRAGLLKFAHGLFTSIALDQHVAKFRASDGFKKVIRAAGRDDSREALAQQGFGLIQTPGTMNDPSEFASTRRRDQV